MEKEIDEIKKSISNLSVKYGIRYIVFKTTGTACVDGENFKPKVEAEMIY